LKKDRKLDEKWRAKEGKRERKRNEEKRGEKGVQ
jgi:hypothetical protein